MARLEVHLLGQFNLTYKNKPINISSRPAQSLFAYLLLNAGTAYRREKLAGMLWPDFPEDTARDNLRHALWRVRKSLEAASATRFLQADDLTISFKATAEYWLDAAELKKLNENASAEELVAALSEYKGELLPGFYEEWLLQEREHLDSVFEHHMARLVSLLEEEKRWPEVLDWGEHWIKLGQKPEAAYRAIMIAYAAQGDMSKVAATYERCTNSLRELGVKPSAQTRLLHERLTAGEEAHEAQSSLVAKVENRRKTNLPIPITTFIGREKEAATVIKLVQTNRLVTLTGPGGVGKTRLAIHCSNRLKDHFNDGVWWVELASLMDETLVSQAVAQVFGVRESPDRQLTESVTRFLHPKHLLLVLDNCEHLISACAQFSYDLLTHCANLRILTTSREALDLIGEAEFPVQALSLPALERLTLTDLLLEYEGIRLFVERANAKSGFTLTEQNAPAVLQICQQLDGIPLALELAAARTGVLAAEHIAERLNERFSFLTQGNRIALPRHQTLRGLIDWSYDLLSEPERVLLRRLSVFIGGWALPAAESVCSDDILEEAQVFELLSQLADKSLVIVDQTDRTGKTRYRLLETIRQYALEKLIDTGDASAIRDQHLEFYLSLAEKSEPNIFGRDSAGWLTRLDKELDNVRAAIEWATNSGKADAALRILGSLFYFWFAHGLEGSEWHDRVQQAFSRPEGMRRSLARAKALNGIGFMYWADVYPTERRPELEEALSIGREFEDPWNTATALRNLGSLENIKGNYPEARSLLEQSLVIWREMGSEGKTGGAWTLIFLGDVALNHYEAEWARSLYEAALEILRGHGDLNNLAYAIRRLAQLAWREGDYQKAASLCKESLNLNQIVGGLPGMTGMIACLAGFANIAVGQGKFERAAQLMSEVETQLSSIGTRLLFVDQLEYDHNLTLLRSQIDQAIFVRAWAEGRAMTLEQAIAFALQESE